MDFRNECILVTGAAGFIGSHVSAHLLRLGAKVVGVDNFDPYYARDLKEHNLQMAKQSSNAANEFIFDEIDICDCGTLEALMLKHKVTGVVHLAAKAGVRPSIIDPVGYAKVNVMGTQSVLTAATNAKCHRVLAASSSSVYGNNEKTPFAETDSVGHPISPYAATKRSCELIADTHNHLTGLPVAMLRFFTVFGPGQRPDLAIRIFLNKISKGETITMFGDGSMSRDFTYIDDIVAGVIAAYEQIDKLGYRIWNLGSDHPMELRELISTVSQVVGREPIIDQQPMQAGDVDKTWADLTLSKQELGYSAKTSIREGIEQQWAWMQEHAEMLGC